MVEEVVPATGITDADIQHLVTQLLPQVEEKTVCHKARRMHRQMPNVQKVEYLLFHTSAAKSQVGQSNIDLLYDIPLEITVELGRTEFANSQNP